ncbi:MAG: DUF1858 domain-containing protein [Deferribacterales bacterium]
MITLNSTIEEIINEKPEAVKYLMEKKIRCIRCGEPIWGTLESVLKDKNLSPQEIEKILEDLNNL